MRASFAALISLALAASASARPGNYGHDDYEKPAPESTPCSTSEVYASPTPESTPCSTSEAYASPTPESVYTPEPVYTPVYTPEYTPPVVYETTTSCTTVVPVYTPPTLARRWSSGTRRGRSPIFIKM